ncbi:carboxypeptidase M32 [Shewanella sp. JM162201]|uniref:Metal-dependent carboxypeptidase n=1 Tax=Shewanella jiangmenensis TaxID=2837387 RepID=A0ABS5V403_9GAMM|nr:carboxypeptidase M32 [Shewanella jiangmenensis]MBT1444424.1 carboxypeptidase M32 [Shewanella jiangmenensis]
MSNHYLALKQHFTQISHFEHFSALGDWDQATMMPMGGSEGRSDAMATLAGHIHGMKTASWLADFIDAAATESLTALEQANLREMKRAVMQANALPTELVEAKTKAAYRCENAWREQRKHNDWQGFKPNLEAVMALVREEAAHRAAATGLSPYDTLLDKFEPGITSARLDDIFRPLRGELPDLIRRVRDRQASEQMAPLEGPFPIAAQEAIGRELMQLLGFDFNQGRLDVSSHPFCGGVPGDVRLTTRYSEQEFAGALLGVIHETGHARYEQGLPLALRGQPAGAARSMGIHESQSLFFEMQLGESPAFIDKITPIINRHLHKSFSAAELTYHYSRVKPGLIRVDADEVTYPCHILLRFEAEKALLDGSLSVADLPDFWSSQMSSLLGINTDGDYRNGCMQDIHWTLGELGYFPSYTLGAMYAAQLRAAMEQQLGPLEELIRQNRLAEVFGWLETHIWSQGSIKGTDQLIQAATGESLSGQYLLSHLKRRYLGE